MAGSVTVRDLAEYLGISRTTVSLGLRNHPGVSKATQLRIHQAAAELGYQKNALVTALMTQVRTRRIEYHGEAIAFLTALNEEFYWKKQSQGEVFEGAREMAEKLGFRLEPCWLGPMGVDSRKASRILRARGVCGLLLSYMPSGLLELDLDWDRYPVVATGYSFRQKIPNRVAANQSSTVGVCFEKLYNLGYRRIGLAMAVQANERVNRYWVSSYFGTQWHWKCPRLEPFDAHGVPDREKFLKWVMREKPDAIMSSFWPDYSAEWLSEIGLTIPGDMGYAGLDVSPQDWGKIAGISQNHRLVGATAVMQLSDMIFRNVVGLPSHPMETTVGVEWKDGLTVRQQNSADPRSLTASRSRRRQA